VIKPESPGGFSSAVHRAAGLSFLRRMSDNEVAINCPVPVAFAEFSTSRRCSICRKISGKQAAEEFRGGRPDQSDRQKK
jgi:hypothetical protein